MDPYIGKFLDDRYEILDVLGTGGMAVVYRAYCHRLNRYVAVKILKGELASDQDLRRRFHDESQAVAMLSHQNIVAIYDVNQIDECEYIVMELIDGITLKQYMQKRGGCLNWREALHFSTQILQALKHAHSRGIIHRDIKPQNVMVLRDGSVKVTDFGIARSTTSQATVTQEAIGSVHYISPEQARGSHIDARSDLYSCGVVLYEMLTGRLPYEGDNPVSVAIQHINSIPILPRELNSAVPEGMEQITMKAMASSVDRRYVNAEQMLQDLDDFRRNPDIVFGYIVPGAIVDDEDEPTMVRKGAGGFVAGADPDEVDAVIRESAPRRAAAAARFERDSAPAVRVDDYDDEEDEDKNKVFIGVVAGIAAALLLIFIILWFTLFKGLFAKEVTYSVPELLGYTVSEAEEYIASDENLNGHFTITIEGYETSDQYEAGTIMDQTPNANRTTTEETTEIKVTVSTGAEEEQPQEIALEDYAGEDYRAVLNALRVLGLDASAEGEYNDDVEKGLVIRTDPEAGTSVLPGDAVTIYYSMGTESFSLPDYTNQDYHDVKAALEELGLRPMFEFEYSDTIELNMVTRTDPIAGSSVKPDDTVIVYYSMGAEEKTVEMTSLLGLTEEDARNAIAAMNLTIGSVTSDYSDTYAAGKVCYQSIPDRTVVAQGAPVSIVISLGPEPEEDPPVVVSKTIVVHLDPARTESCVVEIVINGAVLSKTTVPVETTEVEVVYEGDINSYSITVDGEAYNDFDIIDN